MRNNRGMTLLEVVLSLVILAIVSLALIQTMTLAMNTTVTNELRDEAVRIVETRMNELRNTPFDGAAMQVTAGTVETPVVRKIRSADVSFTITRKISQIDSYNRQVTVVVAWNYRNKPYSHTVSTIMRAQ